MTSHRAGPGQRGVHPQRDPPGRLIPVPAPKPVDMTEAFAGR
jgi:hypothetical protein